jgi:hypothetical protein
VDARDAVDLRDADPARSERGRDRGQVVEGPRRPDSPTGIRGRQSGGVADQGRAER